MIRENINTGIIGFGLSGRVFHAPFIHTHPGFTLKKIVERKSSQSKEIYPYVEIAPDHKAVIEDENLDLIVVCTPNITHYPMVKDSLLAGKHVVVEKPFTPTSKEANELITLSNKVDRKIFVYQNRRWDGDFLTIKKLLKDNLLGDLYSYEAHFDRFNPELKPNWRNENLPGGGILYDLGSHLIDQALHLFGKPKKIFAKIEAQRKNSQVDDYFRLQLEYSKLKVVLRSGMLVEDLGPRYILKGSKASYTKFGIDPQEKALEKGLYPNSYNWGKEKEENWGQLLSNTPNLLSNRKIETEAGNYMGFYLNVFEVLMGREDMKVKPEEARDVIEIIENALKIAS